MGSDGFRGRGRACVPLRHPRPLRLGKTMARCEAGQAADRRSRYKGRSSATGQITHRQDPQAGVGRPAIGASRRRLSRNHTQLDTYEGERAYDGLSGPGR